MISKWPEYSEERNFEKEERATEIIKEAVRGIRNARTSMNVAPSRKAQVYIVSHDATIIQTFTEGKLFFEALSYASEVILKTDKEGIAEDAVSVVIPNAAIYMPFSDLVDIAQEIARLEKEEGRLQGEIKRADGMLSNEKFVSKAPQSKIEEEKAKLANYRQMLEEVTKRLSQLKK